MILALFFALFTKHFVFDFLYQPPYQWQNKGTYGHWGGLVHTFQHVLATFFILLVFDVDIDLIVYACLFEAIVHYHMDWFKMRLNAKRGWKCNLHNEFWILTGLDQYVHALTYIGIVWMIANP